MNTKDFTTEADVIDASTATISPSEAWRVSEDVPAWLMEYPDDARDLIRSYGEDEGADSRARGFNQNLINIPDDLSRPAFKAHIELSQDYLLTPQLDQVFVAPFRDGTGQPSFRHRRKPNFPHWVHKYPMWSWLFLVLYGVDEGYERAHDYNLTLIRALLGTMGRSALQNNFRAGHEMLRTFYWDEFNPKDETDWHAVSDRCSAREHKEAAEGMKRSEGAKRAWQKRRAQTSS